MSWYHDLGMPVDKLRLREHEGDELSHYSSATADVEFLFPWGWDELEGIANRTDFDLNRHAEAAGAKLEYLDPGSGDRYVPHVIEPAAGARTCRALLHTESPACLVPREYFSSGNEGRSFNPG